MPTLSGVDLRKAASLWPTFILLNVGNLARVSSQVATDFTPAAYALMGASGFIEVVGLAWWGCELFRNMRFGVRLVREAQAGAARFEGPFTLTDQSKVADVLEYYSETLEVFLRHGFASLRNPVLRHTMARVVTIEQDCRREGVSQAALLDDLRRAISMENNDVTAS